MTATAQRKHVSIPTLQERVEALALEVFTAPLDQAREAVARWKDVIDANLDARAERLRPKSEIGAIPASAFRQMSWDGRAHGCVCKAAQEALKDD
jgi:transposase